jgi:hypothetical protein
MIKKSNHHSHRRAFIRGVSNDNIAGAARIGGQHLVDFTGENRGLHVQYIEAIIVHFFISMLRQHVSVVDDRTTNPFKLTTGHRNSLLRMTTNAPVPAEPSL